MLRHKNRMAKCIQTEWRKYARTDPLTLERIRLPFALYRWGRMHMYDAFTLADYIRSTGDLTDPTARVEYASHELMRLDRLLQTEKADQLIFLRGKLSEHREKERQNDSITVALEHELDDTIEHTMTIASEFNATRHFKREIMPLLVQCFDNLRTVNPNRFQQLLQEIYTNVMREERLDMNLSLRDSILALLYMLRLSA